MNWATFWDAFTGIGTVAMAVTTALIIRQTRRQHQETLRPICVLVPEKGTDASGRRDILQVHQEPNDPAKYFCLVSRICG